MRGKESSGNLLDVMQLARRGAGALSAGRVVP